MTISLPVLTRSHLMEGTHTLPWASLIRTPCSWVNYFPKTHLLNLSYYGLGFKTHILERCKPQAWEWSWHLNNGVPITAHRECHYLFMPPFISFSNILSFHCINLLPLLLIPNYLILYVALGNAIALVIFFPGGSSWAWENATNCCILTWCLAAAWKSLICYNSRVQWCLQSSIHQWSCPCPV